MNNNNFNITKYIKVFDSGDSIFLEGSKGREMYVIIKGKVEISQLINNERHILSILKPGDFFGEMSTIRGLARSATATAMTYLECVVVAPDIFKNMLQFKPGFGIKVIKELCNRIEKSNKQVERLTLLNQTEKVTAVLVNIATDNGTKPFKEAKILYDAVVSEVMEKIKTNRNTVEKFIVTLSQYAKIKIVEQDNISYISINESILK